MTVKRLFDAAAAAAGLVLLSPLFLLAALWVKLDSPGPVFFLGDRVGRGGVPFRIVKFRSMVRDAAGKGPGITVAGDARVTRSGRFLRRTKLDELPQLWNVLAGEMSLVGPRPEDPRYVALYTAEQRRILFFRPGVTSPASLEFRREEALLSGEGWERKYVEEVMPRKIAADLAYMERATLRGDLAVILATLGGMGPRPAGKT